MIPVKKAFAFILAFFALEAAVFAAAEGEAVYGNEIKDGVYEIDVESSSSMFRVTDCVLTVKDGEMSAVMTLSGTGYEKLYMGTGEEAQSAQESDFVYFEENGEGKYTYTVPVEVLETEIPCAAFSIRKQSWYDRTLVFKADNLPRNEKGGALCAGICALAGIILIAAVILGAFKVKKRKNERA